MCYILSWILRIERKELWNVFRCWHLVLAMLHWNQLVCLLTVILCLSLHSEHGEINFTGWTRVAMALTKSDAASACTKCVISACPHLWIFHYKIKLFMSSRFAQWELYFHKNNPSEEKTDRSRMEMEGKVDLITGHRFCSSPLHLPPFVTASRKGLSLLMVLHVAVSAWYSVCFPD